MTSEQPPELELTQEQKKQQLRQIEATLNNQQYMMQLA